MPFVYILSMTEKKLVLWDLDATILDPIEPEKNSIRRCFEFFGFGECPNELLDIYHQVNISWWERCQSGELPKDVILVERFRDILQRFGYDSSVAKAFNEMYMERLGDTICPVEHAFDVLSELSERDDVIQVLATNGVVASQRKKIDNSGVGAFMDRIYISELVGFEKPEKGFFNSVFSDYPDVDRKNIYMIGDALNTDMAGAYYSKIHSVWFNPKRKVNTYDFDVDFEITDLRDVISIVLG